MRIYQAGDDRLAGIIEYDRPGGNDRALLRPNRRDFALVYDENAAFDRRAGGGVDTGTLINGRFIIGRFIVARRRIGRTEGGGQDDQVESAIKEVPTHAR